MPNIGNIWVPILMKYWYQFGPQFSLSPVSVQFVGAGTLTPVTSEPSRASELLRHFSVSPSLISRREQALSLEFMGTNCDGILMRLLHVLLYWLFNGLSHHVILTPHFKALFT